MVLSKIADLAMIWVQIARQPDGLKIHYAGTLETSAGTIALEIPPEVKFEKCALMLRTAAFGKVAARFEAQLGGI